MRLALAAVAMFTMATSVPAAERLYPLVIDWQEYFRIESQTTVRDGKTLVSGTVWNTSRWSATRIQLLIDGVDAGGTLVVQRVIWLGIDLAAGTRGAFEVPMPAASGYRVSVFAYDSRRGRWG
jgi:hypothetical protein